ncbi:MAG: hypothetical protein ACU0FH_20535 [Heliomarina sp.]|uniref:hypothetical protein n=1 Tax=Heliomarina sp. TaxID=2917556 RepID=UPI0040588C50
MKLHLIIFCAAAMAAFSLAPARAQVVEAATAEARARLACGSGTLVSAQYIGGGQLQVTCSQQSSQSQTQQATTAETALAGTGLTAPVAVGVLAGLTVIGIVSGSDDDAVGTGTTTTTRTGQLFAR